MTGAENYWCNNNPCKYKQISTEAYVICVQCYDRDSSEYKYNDEDEYDLFVKKFMNSINIISSVALSESISNIANSQNRSSLLLFVNKQ